MSTIDDAFADLARRDLRSADHAQIEGELEAIERASRALEAERLRRIAELEARGSFARDGYPSMSAWLAHRAPDRVVGRRPAGPSRPVAQADAGNAPRVVERRGLGRLGVDARIGAPIQTRGRRPAGRHGGGRSQTRRASAPRLAGARWDGPGRRRPRSREAADRADGAPGGGRGDAEHQRTANRSAATRRRPRRDLPPMDGRCQSRVDRRRAAAPHGHRRPRDARGALRKALRARRRGHIAPEDGPRIACDASVNRVIVAGASAPVEIGRRTLVVPAALRRAVVVRDGGCRFRGCDRPPGWCDCHHVEHWADGGSTALDNLVLLCRPPTGSPHGRFGLTIEAGGQCSRGRTGRR